MTVKPPLQKTLNGILHKEDENKHNHEKWEVLNIMRRTDNYLENSFESAAQTQILKQQKQLNGRNHHIPIHINSEY
jgi:hypothetical protein